MKHAYLKLLIFFIFIISCGDPFKNTLSDKSAFEPEYEINQDSFTSHKEGNLHIVKNLYSPTNKKFISRPDYEDPDNQSPFIKFNLKTGEIVQDNEKTWHIAFKGIQIAINGGETPKEEIDSNLTRNEAVEVALINKIFNEVQSIPADLSFKQDQKKGYALSRELNQNQLWNYSMITHLIEPVKKKTLVFKTDKKYVKLELKGFYKNSSMTKNNYGYLSFEYTFL